MVRFEVCTSGWQTNPRHLASFDNQPDALEYAKQNAQHYEKGLVVVQAHYVAVLAVKNTITSNVETL